MSKKLLRLLCVVVIMALLTSCSFANTQTSDKAVKPYDDISYLSFSGKTVYEKSEYNKEDIYTFTFDSNTVLVGNEKLQAKIMENGKNPGLGVRSLHEQGVTGKGVNVAIIDHKTLLTHPEFTGKVTAYYDTSLETDRKTLPKHGPAVTSLLVGETIGVAPGAKVYYAEAPEVPDSRYYADGLYWIIEENKKLPDDEKIRVVSVSAAPSGEGSPFKTNTEMWDEAVLAAQNEGILVLDCRINEETSFISSAFYDRFDPDDISKCTAGVPTSKATILHDKVYVPTSFRTVAEEYNEGSPSYQYTGQGGLSWGIPYAAGVLALGWQVNPSLSNEEIVQILFDTRTKAHDGAMMINPPAFIEAVKQTVDE